jgi:hypothetical protein
MTPHILRECHFLPAFMQKNVPYLVPYRLQHMEHMVHLDMYSSRP